MHQQKLAKHPKRQRTVQVDQRSMRLQKGLSRQLETLLSNISLCCFLPCVIKISIFSSVDKAIRSFLTPCLAGWFLMLCATMTGRGGTRSPAVWCMQLGKCDPYPARCWKQKLVVIVRFCSLLPLWFRVSAWRHVGVGVVNEYIDNDVKRIKRKGIRLRACFPCVIPFYIDNDVKVNLFLLLNPLFS